MTETSVLYVVATPIGNLQDLSRRAVTVLGEVDRVLAEDTRRTGRLLEHVGVKKPMISLHAHNEASRIARVLEWLAAGERLALVSDAGTPLVSDPGRRLVEAVIEHGYRIVPVPGPSAPLSALVVSGLPSDRFTFLGFVPRKGRERTSTLARVAGSEETTILFESAERLTTTLEALVDVCGAGRRAAVARELTKLHEEVTRGTLAELDAYYQAHPARGEVTLVIGPAESDVGDDAARDELARDLARRLLEEGRSPSRVAREIASRTGLSRNDAYTLVQEMIDMPQPPQESP